MNSPVREAKYVDRSLTVRQLMIRYGIQDVLEGDITEFAINRPGEFWFEKKGEWIRQKHPELSIQNLNGLATAIAVYNKKPLDIDTPIQSLTLPDGERCQIVMPPVCDTGLISFTIRKPSYSRFTLDDYMNTGRLNPKITGLGETIQPWEAELKNLRDNGNYIEFFKKAAEYRLNVVTVGGTGSGKTTFSKTMIDLYPVNKRLFTIEDAHELTTPLHPNSVHLYFSAKHSCKEVLASCMRMKPDHIFLTELRGDETWDYLMALKSGHSGSVTSIHANDCRGAMYKIGSYIKQSPVGQTLDMSYIMTEVMTTIDVVLYWEHTYLKEIYYDPEKKLSLLKGASL